MPLIDMSSPNPFVIDHNLQEMIGLETVDSGQRFGNEDRTPSPIGVMTGDAYRDRLALHAHLPSLAQMMNLWFGQKLIVVGGGASIAKTMPQIRRYSQAASKGKPVQIVAVNKSHDYLVKRGIIPQFAALCDPRAHVANYITPRKDVMYWLATGCHPDVFKKFHESGAAFAVWVAVNDEQDRVQIAQDFPPSKGYSHAFVTGGSTCGLRMIPLGSILGFHDFELHGFDSCAAPTEGQAGDDLTKMIKPPAMYAYAKPESKEAMMDNTLTCADGSTFRYFNNINMQQQVRYDIPELMTKSENFKINSSVVPQHIEFAGDGVGPWMAWRAGRHVDPERMERKYGGVKHVDYRFIQKGKPHGR